MSKLYVAYNWIKGSEQGSGRVFLTFDCKPQLTEKVVMTAIEHLETTQHFDNVVPIAFAWLHDDAK